MHSLKATLVWTLIATLLVVYLASASVTFLLVRYQMLRQLDREMNAEAQLVASSIEVELSDTGALLEFELEGNNTSDETSYLEVTDPFNEVLYRSTINDGFNANKPTLGEPGWTRMPSGNLGRVTMLRFAPRIELASADDDDNEDRIWQDRTGTVEDDQDQRPVTSSSVKDYYLTLVLARDASEYTSTLWQVVVSTAVGTAGGIFIMAIMLVVVIRVSLRPLDRLAAEIDNIEHPTQQQHLPTRDLPSELLPVVQKFNALLDRTVSAFNREKAFSADVAHELRTPLAGLRTSLEVLLLKPRSSEEYEQQLERCTVAIDAMQQLVHNLLTLAHLEGDINRLQVAPVDLDEMVQRCWQDVAESADSLKVRVAWSLAAEQMLATDTGLLEMVVRNLLENSVRYVDHGGDIHIATHQSNGRTTLLVENSGSRIPADQAQDVWQRFWRGDKSRKPGHGNGIGLSLVANAVRRIGGEVNIQTEVGGRFQVLITLMNLSSSGEVLAAQQGCNESPHSSGGEDASALHSNVEPASPALDD